MARCMRLRAAQVCRSRRGFAVCWPLRSLSWRYWRDLHMCPPAHSVPDLLSCRGLVRAVAGCGPRCADAGALRHERLRTPPGPAAARMAPATRWRRRCSWWWEGAMWLLMACRLSRPGVGAARDRTHGRPSPGNPRAESLPGDTRYPDGGSRRCGLFPAVRVRSSSMVMTRQRRIVGGQRATAEHARLQA